MTSGEISQLNLYQRLASQGLPPIEREIITTALNIFNANNNAVGGNSAIFGKPNNLFPQMKGTPIPIQPQGSPLSPVPPPIDPHLLFQHQAAAAAANKLRLSPLPAAGNMRFFKDFLGFRFALGSVYRHVVKCNHELLIHLHKLHFNSMIFTRMRSRKFWNWSRCVTNEFNE